MVFEGVVAPLPISVIFEPFTPVSVRLTRCVDPLPVTWRAVPVVPVMFTLPVSDGEAANTSEPVPVSSETMLASCDDVVDANWFRPLDVSAIELAHAKPVPDVQRSALLAPLQLGIANAVGLAVEPVTFATTVLAACVARAGSVTRPVAVSEPVTLRFVNVAAFGFVPPMTDPLIVPPVIVGDARAVFRSVAFRT
ncbi:hypothetical protein WJ09_03115 [Burkholderia vietnamiensis]|nr:hypothetical protein WJ09_03115 [Burkholderia vietnamiensis]